MPFLTQIPEENSRNNCTLPNGAQLIITVRLRSFFWTIQLSDINDVILTEECPLVYNPNLFKQYPDVTSKYGTFSVTEEENTALGLEEKLNNDIRLWWAP
jgi:hypothetical protein